MFYWKKAYDLKANVRLIVAPSLATRRVKEFFLFNIFFLIFDRTQHRQESTVWRTGSDQSSIFSDAEFDMLLQIFHKIHLTMIIQACT